MMTVRPQIAIYSKRCMSLAAGGVKSTVKIVQKLVQIRVIQHQNDVPFSWRVCVVHGVDFRPMTANTIGNISFQ